jgi:hypothetical protein
LRNNIPTKNMNEGRKGTKPVDIPCTKIGSDKPKNV